MKALGLLHREHIRQADDSERVTGDRDPLGWAKLRREFNGIPMEVPGPLRAIYTDLSPRAVIMKGAQIGISEWAINLSLWTADIGYAGRGNSLYIMPSGATVGDFVQARVNPAIQESDYLRQRIRPDGSTKDPDKVGLRRVGAGYTYWRSAGSRTNIRSVDADVVVLDEYDLMANWVLPMAAHRLDSSETGGLLRVVSTPTYPSTGVDVEFLAGDRRHFHIVCQSCSHEQPIDWPENIEIAGEPRDSNCVVIRVCRQCRDSIEPAITAAWTDSEERFGRWIPDDPGGLSPSYQLSRLYRPALAEPDAEGTTGLVYIARSLASSNPQEVQEAWNQDLGLPYAPAGGQLSVAEIRRACVEPRRMADLAGLRATRGAVMGVDVGARLHVWIEGYVDGQLTTLWVGEVEDFGALDEVMRRWAVRYCVVDALPELHAADDFKRRHGGRVWLCEYVRERFPATWTTDRERDGKTVVKDPRRQFRIQVDRTSAMDGFASRLRGEDSEVYGWAPELVLPRDAESVPGLFAHLQAPIRQIVTTKVGRVRAVYDEGSRPDHYYHAGTYANLALQIRETGSGREPLYVT